MTKAIAIYCAAIFLLILWNAGAHRQDSDDKPSSSPATALIIAFIMGLLMWTPFVVVAIRTATNHHRAPETLTTTPSK